MDEAGNPDLMFSYLDVKGTLTSLYENPLTSSVEPFIEPWTFSLLLSQKEPLTRARTEITSKEKFNLNLTYGFFSSVVKAIKNLKDSNYKNKDFLKQDNHS